jgi:hypothetical protein
MNAGRALSDGWRSNLARTYGSALVAQFLVALVGIVLHVGLARAYGLDLYANYVVSMSFTAAISSLLVGLLFEPYLVLSRHDTGEGGGSGEYESLVTAACGLILVATTLVSFGLLHRFFPDRGNPWEYVVAALGIGCYCSILILSSRRAAIEGDYRRYVLGFALGAFGAMFVATGQWFSSPVFAGWAVYALTAIPVLSQLRFDTRHLTMDAVTRSVRLHAPYSKWSTASSALGVGAMQLSAGVIGSMIDPFLLARYRLALIVPSVLEHAFIAISNQLVRHTIEKRPIAAFIGSNRMRVAVLAAFAYCGVGLLSFTLAEYVLESISRADVPMYKWSVLLVLLGGYAVLLGGFANVELKARSDPKSICMAYAASSASGIAMMYFGARLEFPWTMEASYVLSSVMYATVLLLRVRRG